MDPIESSNERLRNEVLEFYEVHKDTGDMPDDLLELETYIMRLGNSQAKATAIVAHTASLRIRIDRAFSGGGSGAITAKRALLGELGGIKDTFKNLTFSIQELLKTAKFIYEVKLERMNDD